MAMVDEKAGNELGREHNDFWVVLSQKMKYPLYRLAKNISISTDEIAYLVRDRRSKLLDPASAALLT